MPEKLLTAPELEAYSIYFDILPEGLVPVGLTEYTRLSALLAEIDEAIDQWQIVRARIEARLGLR